MDLGKEKPELQTTSVTPITEKTKGLHYPSVTIEKNLPIDVKYGDQFTARCQFRVKEITEGEILYGKGEKEVRIVLELTDILPDKPSNKGLPQHRDNRPFPGMPMSGD